MLTFEMTYEIHRSNQRLTYGRLFLTEDRELVHPLGSSGTIGEGVLTVDGMDLRTLLTNPSASFEETHRTISAVDDVFVAVDHSFDIPVVREIRDLVAKDERFSWDIDSPYSVVHWFVHHYKRPSRERSGESHQFVGIEDEYEQGYGAYQR